LCSTPQTEPRGPLGYLNVLRRSRVAFGQLFGPNRTQQEANNSVEVDSDDEDSFSDYSGEDDDDFQLDRNLGESDHEEENRENEDELLDDEENAGLLEDAQQLIPRPMVRLFFFKCGPQYFK